MMLVAHDEVVGKYGPLAIDDTFHVSDPVHEDFTERDLNIATAND